MTKKIKETEAQARERLYVAYDLLKLTTAIQANRAESKRLAMAYSANAKEGKVLHDKLLKLEAGIKDEPTNSGMSVLPTAH